MKYLKEKLFVLFNPSFWFNKYPINKELSDQLLKMIENKEEIHTVTKYIRKIGNITVWTEQPIFGEFLDEKYNAINCLPEKYVRVLLKKYLKDNKQLYYEEQQLTFFSFDNYCGWKNL